MMEEEDAQVKQKLEMSFFDRYLTVWVALCMVAGVLIGKFLPGVPALLGRFEYAQVSIPIAALIWLMIWPMMMKVDFASIKNVGRNPKGLYVTWVTNWLIKFFTMYAIAAFFFFVVFKALIPRDTLFLSVGLFVVVPLAGGTLTRFHVIKTKGLDYFNKAFLPKFGNVTIGGLLLTLVLIFSVQGEIIVNNPLHILLIAVPLIIQTYLIFFVAYLAAKKLNLAHEIAAPAGMIGASNFFELAVAVAISLFGASSPVVLATVVGVLTEVPVMLHLVKIANRTANRFGAVTA